MHAFLILGLHPTERSAFLAREMQTRGIAPFDQITLDKPDQAKSIGIDAVRPFIASLSLGATTKNGKAGIIPEAHLLTEEAQQALLKTIEEPPSFVVLYLCSDNESALLPTIVSRCQCQWPSGQTSAVHQDEEPLSPSIETLLSLSKGKRLALLSTVSKTKEDLIAWTDAAITATGKKGRYPDLFHALIRAKALSKAYCSLRSLIEQIFLR